MITRDWHGCYARDWNGTLHPDAYVHPAKVAYGLAERIYNHCMAQGYFKPGDTVLDPFFGVGGFAFHALLNGLNVVGIELEPNFVELARKNLELWRGKYGPGVAVLDDLRARGKLAPYGAAMVLQGDSRSLRQVITESGTGAGVVSSPPYAESLSSATNGIDWTKCKKDYPGRMMHDERIAMLDKNHSERRYTGDPNNLGNLPPGGFASVIGSPPYVDSVHDGNGIDADKLTGNTAGKHSQAFNEGYGRTEGQLGAMHAISSPPYEGLRQDGGKIALELESNGKGIHPYSGEPCSYWHTQRDQDNLGNNRADDFWSAASLIMSEVAAVLPAGAYAVWVCKRLSVTALSWNSASNGRR